MVGIGGADEDRTHDLLNAIQALSQTELRPHAVGSRFANAPSASKFLRRARRILLDLGGRRAEGRMADGGWRRAEGRGQKPAGFHSPFSILNSSFCPLPSALQTGYDRSAQHTSEL